MMRQWEGEAAEEERKEEKAGRPGGMMKILGPIGGGGGGGGQQGGNEEAAGSDEENEEDEEEGDCFFESLDRVQSSVSFAMDFPSSDDEDEEDDVRISFASAVAPPCDFRRISFARHEDVVCDTDDDQGGGQDFDYDIWMAEPMEMSLMERRRRLLEGMGLTSSKDLARSRSSNRTGRIPSTSRLASSRLSSCVTASNDAVQEADAAAKAAATSPAPSPPPVITRCRSDTELVAAAIRGSASPRSVLKRAFSSLPSVLDQRGPPRSWGMLGQEGGGGGGGREGTRGEGDDVDGPSLTLAKSVRIKNLDTGKEFVVSEISKDGTWGRLNDLQTGLQLTMDEFEKFLGYSRIVKELMHRANLGGAADSKNSTNGGSQRPKSSKSGARKKGSWLKNIKFVASSMTGLISEKDKGDGGSNAMGKSSGGSNSSDWLKVHQHGKSYKELTGLYMCQEIHAHQGSIWTMKFSFDRRYLASAGEDRVVHVWQVIECDAFSSSMRRHESRSCSRPHQPSANGSPDRSASQKKMKKGKSRKKSIPDYIVMPETIFSLTEKPVCSFEGHLDDVLDLSWSKSQYLLSSSMDKTVRLWDIESKACLKLFAHNDYVTCVQFNPVDDSYFISGSLDAKVRIWSIPNRQVVDWSDLHEMVTAVCYTPDGQGALVGSNKGSCRFYKISDCKLNQEAQIDIRNKKKKSHAKKITGFQFAPGNPSEVLITSADSQIRAFDGLDMVHKFRGFRNTSSQISASYTSDGKYVVCASEDSNVYIWKRDPARSLGAGGKSKGWSTTRSHEHFCCKDVSVAIPWPGNGNNRGLSSSSLPSWSRRYTHERGESSDSQISAITEDNFSSSRRHHPPLPKKSSSDQTLPCAEEFRNNSHSGSEIGSESFVSSSSSSIRSGAASPSISESGTFSSSLPSWGWSFAGSNSTSNASAANAWGLVVVTATLGGDIRIYQNFGMPLRLSRQTNLFY